MNFPSKNRSTLISAGHFTHFFLSAPTRYYTSLIGDPGFSLALYPIKSAPGSHHSALIWQLQYYSAHHMYDLQPETRSYSDREITYGIQSFSFGYLKFTLYISSNLQTSYAANGRSSGLKELGRRMKGGTFCGGRS